VSRSSSPIHGTLARAAEAFFLNARPRSSASDRHVRPAAPYFTGGMRMARASAVCAANHLALGLRLLPMPLPEKNHPRRRR